MLDDDGDEIMIEHPGDVVRRKRNLGKGGHRPAHLLVKQHVQHGDNQCEVQHAEYDSQDGKKQKLDQLSAKAG